jgi:hypothetical protein
LACASLDVQPDPLSGERLFERVVRYASLGDHRSGGDGDRATSRWLAHELAALGFAVELQPFALSQFFPTEQLLRIDGRELAVFPHWLPKPTPAPIRATLAPITDDDLGGRIAYLAPRHAGEWYRVRPAELARSAAAKGALALVIAVPHPSGEIYVTNASLPFLTHPLPIPTVVVASREADAIAAAMARGTAARLVSAGSQQQVEAHNILARYPATPRPGVPWVVVSTPTSGWFRCAGERGSGVALWLGLAEWIGRGNGGAVNWLFVANSGHELAFAGAHHSLPLVPSPDRVALWLHLGASIAARAWDTSGEAPEPLDEVHANNQMFYARGLLPVVEAAFGDVPELELLPHERLVRSNSELGEILHRGYSAIGLVGPHHFFHTPGDLPAVTSPALLAPYGEALRRLARRFAPATSQEVGAPHRSARSIRASSARTSASLGSVQTGCVSSASSARASLAALPLPAIASSALRAGAPTGRASCEHTSSNSSSGW